VIEDRGKQNIVVFVLNEQRLVVDETESLGPHNADLGAIIVEGNR